MLALKKFSQQTKALKNQLPVLGEALSLVQKCNSLTTLEHQLTYGAGGRNSFNGQVITVFGATGFIGRYVTNRLARSGAQLIIPYRGVDDDVRPIRVMGELGQIKFLEYNLRDYESLMKSMTHSRTVINLVGRDFDTLNFTMTDALVTGAADIARAAADSGVNQLIHVSALGASGDSPSFYHRLKARSEREVSINFPEATIMRPASCYGDEDVYFNKYAYLRNLRFGVPLVGGGMETTRRPAFVVDVAKAIVAAAGDQSSKEKTFELYGPEEYYLRDIVEFIYRNIKRPLRIVSVPQIAYHLAGYAGEFSPFNKRFTRDLAIRQFLSEEISSDTYTFEDLGLSAQNVNDTALSILRRHRDYYHHNLLMGVDEQIKPVSVQ